MKEILYVIATFLIGALVGIGIGYSTGRMKCPSPCEVIIDHTDTTSVTDTSQFQAPQPKDSTRVDTIYIKVPYPVETAPKETPADTASSGQECHSETANGGTPPDSLIIPLERERKVYQDSTYKAVVSGFQPSLDYIETYQHTVFIETTKIVREERSPWALSIHGGYGITPQGLQPELSIGVSYILWQPKKRHRQTPP